MYHHLTPKFSVITVTYNAADVLEDTIQSVITQTYHHVEYIIIDGGSTDGTLDIVERYPRPHCPRHQRTRQRAVRRHEQRHGPRHGRLPVFPQRGRQFPRRRHPAASGTRTDGDGTARHHLRRNGTGGPGGALCAHAPAQRSRAADVEKLQAGHAGMPPGILGKGVPYPAVRLAVPLFG